MITTRKTILVMSGKGGVGKSSIVANLSFFLAGKGHSVGVLDADMHGPNMLELLHLSGHRMTMENGKIIPIEAKPNLRVVSVAGLMDDDSAVIWRGPMKHNAIKQLIEEVNWGKLDYLIVDFPPGTGDEHISAAQLLKDITGAVIVTTPQHVSMLDMKRAVDFCRKMNIPIIGLVENMSGDIFGKGTIEKFCKKEGIDFLGDIPMSREVVLSGEDGKPLYSYGNSNLDGKFMAVAEHIIDKAEK